MKFEYSKNGFETLLQIVLSILLLICLFDMPYGYYELVRFISMVSFIWMTCECYKEKKENLAFVFGALAVLFQPFMKISLGRGLWNLVDFIVAVFLILLCINNKKKK